MDLIITYFLNTSQMPGLCSKYGRRNVNASKELLLLSRCVKVDTIIIRPYYWYKQMKITFIPGCLI